MCCLVGGARNFQTARNSCPALLAQHRRHLQRARCRGSTLQIIDRHHHHCASKQPLPNVQCTLGQMSPYVFSERRLLLVHWMLRKCPPWPTVMVIIQTLCCTFCDMSTTLHPLQCFMIPIQTFLSTGCKRI